MASPSPLETQQSRQIKLPGYREIDKSSKSGWEALWAAKARRNTKRIAEAAVELRQIYDSGIPFFTKNGIRDLASQLKAINSKIKHEGPSKGEATVLIHQVNGKTRDQVVGLCQPSMWNSDLELDQDGPATTNSSEETIEYLIWYRTYQALLVFGHFAPLAVASEGRNQDRLAEDLIATREPIPLEDVRETLNGAMKAWEAGECCKQLRAGLQTTPWIPPVNKIIAFSCGSISNKDYDCSRSLKQHAFILTIRDVLENRRRSSGAGAGEIRCYVQDPAYTDVDRTVLLEHGITVLEDPQGFLEVDGDSAVLSFASNVPVKQIVADIARPAMIAWETVGHQDGHKRKYLECLSLTRADEVLAGSEEYEAGT